MILRFLSTLIIIISILFFPYWVYIPFLLLSTLLFSFYWEAIILAFLIDVIFGNNTSDLFVIFSPLALVVCVILIFLLPLRERLRAYV